MFQRHVDTLQFFHLLQMKNECTVRIRRTLLRIAYEFIFIVSYLQEKNFINCIFLCFVYRLFRGDLRRTNDSFFNIHVKKDTMIQLFTPIKTGKVSPILVDIVCSQPTLERKYFYVVALLLDVTLSDGSNACDSIVLRLSCSFGNTRKCSPIS